MVDWYLLKLNADLAWGFSIKTPTTSAAEMALLCPPPSTLFGALARGLAYQFEDWSECIVNPKINRPESSTTKILDFIISAHFGFSKDTIAITPWSDLTHSSAIPYQQVQHRVESKRAMWFGVHASGKIYAANSHVNIIYVIRSDNAEKKLGSDWKDKLKRAGFCILTLGSKEGIIVIKHVEVIDAKVIDKTTLKTSYYLPAEAVKDYKPQELCEGEFWEHRYISPHWRGTFRRKDKAEREEVTRTRYILPLDKLNFGQRNVTVHLSEQGIGLTAADGSPEYTVILLKDWMA
ncbi:type I-A CRISPR-associated protein Cas5a [Candidatus Hecatella orcuttiae]|uniref:type I-A CRISPR-associated protein Cas5a n=1 Tax=Candidatus Hecatella orcuttiae TaxID=1935119 RepID=UPI002867ED5C|nr:type I-A CRISPR-associated protein Cas5a [Candidatus Hecatella orcuttiae]